MLSEATHQGCDRQPGESQAQFIAKAIIQAVERRERVAKRKGD